MAWTDPRTWAAGETVTATLMNTHIRDNFNAIGEVNTTWTPTWSTAGTAPVLGNGTLVGRYVESSDWCDFFIHLSAGGSTTFGTNDWRFDLPVNAQNRRFSLLGNAFDISTGDEYPLHVTRTGADEITVKCDGTVAGGPARTVTVARPFAWGTGDVLWIAGRYPR